VLEARPDLAKAFRDATLKGLVYALDHPAEIADLILARYNTQSLVDLRSGRRPRRRNSGGAKHACPGRPLRGLACGVAGMGSGQFRVGFGLSFAGVGQY
jgi:hypothetical protein